MQHSIPISTDPGKLISVCSDVFDGNERFSLGDSVISTALARFHGNDSLELVLPKVILINSFYSTQIYDTERIARRILDIDADPRLEAGDLTLVDDIRHGHGIRTRKTNVEIDFYSFATKYAALHELTRYPLFDGMVMRLLSSLNRQMKFCVLFTQTDLRDYGRYVSVIDALMEYTGLEALKYKRFDQGLWMYAKYLFDRTNLTDSDIAAIDTVLRK